MAAFSCPLNNVASVTQRTPAPLRQKGHSWTQANALQLRLADDYGKRLAFTGSIREGASSARASAQRAQHKRILVAEDRLAGG